MNKGNTKSAMTWLTLAFILAGISMYLNNKKNRELIALNETKSKLTTSLSPGLKTFIQQNLVKKNEAPAPVEDALTKERVYTEIELKEMSESAFTELVKDTFARLPKQS